MRERKLQASSTGVGRVGAIQGPAEKPGSRDQRPFTKRPRWPTYRTLLHVVVVADGSPYSVLYLCIRRGRPTSDYRRISISTLHCRGVFSCQRRSTRSGGTAAGSCPFRSLTGAMTLSRGFWHRRRNRERFQQFSMRWVYSWNWFGVTVRGVGAVSPTLGGSCGLSLLGGGATPGT